MDNNKIDPRAFQAETVYEQEMAGVVGAGPSMANEAASVAQMTDEKIMILRRETYQGAHAPRASDLAFARALLGQAAPPAAPVRLTDEQYQAVSCCIADYRNEPAVEPNISILRGLRSLLAAPAAPATGGSGAEPYRQRSARLSAGRLSDAERAAIEAIYATPPAAEAASTQQDEREANAVLDHLHLVREYGAARFDEAFNATDPMTPMLAQSWAIKAKHMFQAIEASARALLSRAAQQVQAGGADKRYRIGAAWKRGGSAGYTRTSLPENARDGQYQLWAELIQPFTALSREQPQPSNGDREGGAS